MKKISEIAIPLEIKVSIEIEVDASNKSKENIITRNNDVNLNESGILFSKGLELK